MTNIQHRERRGRETGTERDRKRDTHRERDRNRKSIFTPYSHHIPLTVIHTDLMGNQMVPTTSTCNSSSTVPGGGGGGKGVENLCGC